ncbi:MAG: family 43 glycosylhydrolase [Clostridia bacterium]|nr:family 43 glycosylhydrolase [Clostridia bacterium]
MQYSNPILYGDYSDPDVCRVGEDFYLISSSFTYLPGIPVLHSKDLVTWEQVGHAVPRLPYPRYDVPAHRCGTWAPSIRWHDGLFYVYVCLPDEGLYAFTAKSPEGPWETHYVKDVVGWIDPCPLFDDDGRAYLVHGLAASRSGINNMLFVHEMSPDGFSILDKGRLVYDGADHGDTTVEGPKFYKKDGVYYIFCPAGGVAPGYQLCLRSQTPCGPYERRVVLQQGSTDVNGPHQGGWVDDGHGRDFFIHFQDVGPYGRICHLQPLVWADGWPQMGQNGEPVREGDTGLSGQVSEPLSMSDDFSGDSLALRWQFQANPRYDTLQFLHPGLRMQADVAANLYESPCFLSQLMLHRNFDMTVRVKLHAKGQEMAGLAMMGYGYTGILLKEDQICLIRGKVIPRDRWHRDEVTETVEGVASWDGDSVVLCMSVREGKVRYGYGKTGDDLRMLEEEHDLTVGGWVGARPGIFCLLEETETEKERGCADFTDLHVTEA